MKKKKLYRFSELPSAAQEQAAEQIYREDLFSLGWEDIHKRVTKEVLHLFRSFEGGVSIGWDASNHGDKVIIDRFNITIPEHMTMKKLSKEKTDLVEQVKKLHAASIWVEWQHDFAKYLIHFELDPNLYTRNKDRFREWIHFIRDNENMLAPTHENKTLSFDERWKRLRFSLRMEGDDEMANRYRTSFLVREVEEIANNMLKPLATAYEEVYQDLMNQARSFIEKRIHYYDKTPYILDCLRTADRGTTYRYYVDGQLIVDEESEVVSCVECGQSKEMGDIAYTEENGKYQIVCKTCAVPIMQ